METLFILTLLLYAVTARCMTGIDWQVAGVPDDFGTDGYTTAYVNVSFIDNSLRTHSLKTEVGRYGNGPVGASSGLLVHITSETGAHTACDLPLRSSWGDLPKQPWIALIQRGQCDFEVKVENAFRHNAAAVIIYNDRESPVLDKMKLSSTTRNISAIFTFKWKGEELARLVDSGSRVYVQISVATHCSKPNTHVNRTSVLFVSISFIVLMIISLAWLVFYYVQRFRYMHAKDRLSKRLCTAAKRALSKIPTKQVVGEDKEVMGDECCAVCIEPYKITDDLRVLPCTHEFHKTCIDPWLLEHRTCPMCKMDILKHYGFVFTGSQESILQVEDDRPQTLENPDLFVVGRGTAGGVRSEPVSRVSTPTLQIQGQFYTLQVARGDDQCSYGNSSGSSQQHPSTARSNRKSGGTASVHTSRPSSCVPDMDRTKLLLDNDNYYDSSGSSGPNSPARDVKISMPVTPDGESNENLER